MPLVQLHIVVFIPDILLYNHVASCSMSHVVCNVLSPKDTHFIVQHGAVGMNKCPPGKVSHLKMVKRIFYCTTFTVLKNSWGGW